MTNEIDAGVTLEYLDEIGDAFNRHDVDAIVGMFAEDGVLQLGRGTEAWGTRLTGKHAIRTYLTRRFAEFGNMRWEPITRFVAGNRAVSEWVVTATLAGGKELKLYGCDLYEFRGRKIVKKDTYWKSKEPTV